MKSFQIALITLLTMFSAESFAGIWSNKKDISVLNQRKSRIYIPKNYSSNKKYPLVVSLHGYKGSRIFQNFVLPFNKLVTKKQFILVVPEGIKDNDGKRFWNGKNCCTHKTEGLELRDDVNYLRTLIKEIQATHSIDSENIIVAGHSNGGFMSVRMACEASDLVTGIINYVGAGYIKPEECNPTRSINVIHVHGKKDKVIKYNGHPEWHPSALDSAKNWVKLNKCEEPKSSTHKSYEVIKWSGCPETGNVTLWTLPKSGHVKLWGEKDVGLMLNSVLNKIESK